MREVFATSTSSFVTGLFLFLGAAFLPAQTDNTTREANELVGQVVANELMAYEQDQSHWRYWLRKEEHGQMEIREIVETRDGTLDSLLFRNGQPLTPEECRKDDERIQSELRKKRQKKQEDAGKAIQLLKLLPAAFLFEYESEEGTLLRLRFKPNPDFHPPSREAQVLHNLEGIMWIDREQKRLARIDAHLMDEVKFGGGLLGRLERGGKFSLRRAEVAPGYWKTTYRGMALKGKVILFKAISVQEEDYLTNFRKVPSNLTLQQAAEILTKQSTAPSMLISKQLQ